MNTEGKAKAYNKVREKIALRFGSNVAEEIFSEFEETDDERIRKDIIAFIKKRDRSGCDYDYDKWLTWLEKQKEYESTDFEYVWDRTDCGDLTSALDKYSEEAIINMCHAWYDKGIELERKSWLEKQGEHLENHDDEDILQRFSFYSYKDEPNILYLAGLYVNDKYRNKGIGTKILEVADEVAKSLNCHAIRLKTKKDSNAERLYQTHGYNSLAIEGRDKIWLEKQGKQKPRYSIGDVLCDKSCTTLNKDTQPNFEIVDIRNGMYICDKGSFPISQQDEYELVAKKIDHKTTDKVVPKFQNGQWIVHHGTENIYQVVACIDNQYQLKYGDNYTIQKCSDVDRCARLWDITKDAKDGDVLACESGWTCIFKTLVNDETFSSYCFMDNTKWFCETGSECHKLKEEFVKAYNGKLYPATKEQCDLLFSKMHEEGYEWSEETHELKKIKVQESEDKSPININEMVAKYSQTKDGDFGLPINCQIRAYRQGINDTLNLLSCIEKQGEQKPTKNIVETWKDMRLEVYQQASGNRHEPNYSDDTTKMFSLNDIDEIIEKLKKIE